MHKIILKESAYMRTNNRRKSSISINTFISEFGENFSDHMKEKLMGLESRCFLSRKDVDYRLDIRHVEHIKYESPLDSGKREPSKKKEYVYGQLAVIDNKLYFSESCRENDEVMRSPEVSGIYEAIDNENMIADKKDGDLKKLDDNNIDYVTDRILSICPQTSQAYQNIVQGMISRSNSK